MSDILVSRRGFMQGAGAAVLAAACSGMLTGCSGGNSGSNEPSEVTLGDYKVKVTSVEVTDTQILGENGIEYVFTPKVKLTFIGSGLAGKKFKDVFSATMSGVELTLENKSDTIFSMETPVINVPQTYSPKFTTDDKAAYRTFASGEDSIVLTVSLNQQTAKYTVSYSPETKKYNVDLSTT